MLESKYIEDDMSLAITDDLLDLARALPNIEVLHLSGARKSRNVSTGFVYEDPVPILSIGTITNLTSKCTRLRSLKLTVNAAYCSPPFIHRPSSLTFLDLGHSWIKNVQNVANWLEDICPADGIVSHRTERETGLIEVDKRLRMWDEVKSLLKVQQAERRNRS
jgi:hypothetical protein